MLSNFDVGEIVMRINSYFYEMKNRLIYASSIVLVTLIFFILFNVRLTELYIIVLSFLITAQIWIAYSMNMLPKDMVQRLKDTENNLKKSEKEKYFLTHYNTITKLPNKRLVLEKMNGNLKRMTVLVFEIDRLATLKTSLGSHCSNCLLQMIAERLQGNLLNDYFIGNLQEDQFVLLIDNH